MKLAVGGRVILLALLLMLIASSWKLRQGMPRERIHARLHGWMPYVTWIKKSFDNEQVRSRDPFQPRTLLSVMSVDTGEIHETTEEKLESYGTVNARGEQMRFAFPG